MHRASIPIVTGIGHEVDFTIADLVADLRAPTPSVAAESVVPDAGEWAARYRALEARLVAAARRGLAARGNGVRMLAKRLVHPRRRLFDHSQRLDAMTLRLARAANGASRGRRGAALHPRRPARTPCAGSRRPRPSRPLRDARTPAAARDARGARRLPIASGRARTRPRRIRTASDPGTRVLHPAARGRPFRGPRRARGTHR